MEKEKLEALLIDYIDGVLSPADRLIVEKEIAENESAKILYQQLSEVMTAMDKSDSIDPGQNLRNSFNRLLEAEIEKQKPSKTIFFQPAFYRIAASLLIIVTAIGVANLVYKNHQQQLALDQVKIEMATTKQLMMAMIDNQQSASQRLQGVNVAMKIERADNDVVEALMKRMNEDPNTNVRLAALEALSKFHEEPAVRKLLIKSLSEQKDPVVQIALIQLMVRMKEKDAVKKLEQIIDDNGTMNAVKDEAYSGILKLS